jgi:hypothetical protein
VKAFIQELRTQYIYRIAAAYMVSSWLILQITSLLCSALGLPNWTLKAILALLLVGFGAALIIGSWFDLRTARLAVGGPRQWSRKVHLVLWPAGAMLIVGGTTLVVSAFLDANRTSQPLSVEVQSSVPPAESVTPVPEIVLTDGTRVSLGEQQVLLNDQDLGLRSMPAAGIAVIENRPGRIRFLLGASTKTYLLEGVDLKHLNALPRLVLGPGEPGTFDNAAADVFAVVQAGSKFYAFYQASDSEGLPAATLTGYSGFYLSIGLAESDDNGYTWVKRGQIIKCAKPKEWAANPQQGGRGIGWGGGLADASGQHFYIYYTDLSTARAPVGQINVARCSLEDGPPLPGNWKKYYNGAFTEPAIGGKETPILDIYSAGRSGAWYGRPTYSRLMGKYIMVFAVNQPREWQAGLPPRTSGIYLAVSDDLINWSEQFKLISGYTQRVLGKAIVMSPTMVFEQPDKMSAWLTYGYSPKYSTETLSNLGTPIYLVGRRISFKRANQ